MDEPVLDVKGATKVQTTGSKPPPNAAEVIDLCDSDSDDDRTTSVTHKKRASDSSLVDRPGENSAKKQRLKGTVKKENQTGSQYMKNQAAIKQVKEKQEMEKILKENREMMLSIDATHVQLKEAT